VREIKDSKISTEHKTEDLTVVLRGLPEVIAILRESCGGGVLHVDEGCVDKCIGQLTKIKLDLYVVPLVESKECEV